MFLSYFIYNLIDFKILERYLSGFSHERRWESDVINNAVYLFCVVCLSAINNIGNPNINLLCFFICMILFGFTFKNSLVSSVLPLALYLGIGFIAEPVGILLTKHLLDKDLSFYFSYILSLAFSLFVRGAVIEIIRQYKKVQMQSVPLKISAVLLIILAIGIFECCTAIWLVWYLNVKIIDVYGLAVIVGVLLINILVLWLLEKYQNLFEHMRHNDLLLQEAEAKEAYYREVEASNYEIRKIRHDLKNRLLGISSLKDIALINKSIRSIIEELEGADSKIYTQNTVVNTILNIKINRAEKEKIRCKINVFIPKLINMDYGDAGILYGNLLDNSIEACKELPTKKRWIDVNIVYQTGILIIKISNSRTIINGVEGKNVIDRKNHGFGLKSVKGIVEKYGV